jgi:hypothetical protein
VGHALASTLVPDAGNDKSHLDHPVHLPTVQYLITNILPLCMEGLYSKTSYMSQCCAQCIKNLVVVQPALCATIVVPFLLAALDPAAVSQAHQAPVAMQTLSSCFKPLMYPQPVLLRYLPDILRLSLPGVEPSDVTKTSITLHLYCTVLAWLPTTLRPIDASSGDTPTAAYIDLLPGSGAALGKVVPAPKVSVDVLNDQIQQVSEYIQSEWASALLARLFALLEAQEAAIEGAKSSPLAGAVGQVCSYLFQALRDLPSLPDTHELQVKQRQLRSSLQAQVQKFYTTSTPVNGVKGCAKVVEAMVTADPSLLPKVLRDLLCPPSAPNTPAAEVATVLLGAFSSDKLAFRLRLAGGACRAATSEQLVQCLDLLVPIVTSAAFYNHDEKAVRVATGKLLKDLLKGATSIYPTAIQPTFAENAAEPVGAPNTSANNNVRCNSCALSP